MRGFLVKLNFGLRDLSFFELGKCGSLQGGVRYNRGGIMRERRTTEFYMEWFDVNVHRNKLTFIPMHVHKLEDGVKLGAPCSRQHCLVKIFSIGKYLSSGKFVLKPNEELDSRFCVTVQINRCEVFSSHQKGSMLTLKHGDIIEFFLQGIRELTCTIETELFLSEVMLVKQHLTDYFRMIQAMKPQVMFLLTNECLVQVPQTSALLLCPWPVLQNIFQFLTPFETMENLVPVCRQFFQLMRSGAIWTRVLFNVDFEKAYVPYGHLGDLCTVIAPRIRMLLLDVGQLWGRRSTFLRSILCSSFESDDWRILKLLEIYSSGRDDFVTALLENRQFCAKLETLLVSCVDCVSLLFRGITGEGPEICFPNVREVTLRCSLEADFSVRPSNVLTYLDFLGSGVLRSLHAKALPLKFSKDDWLLAQSRGTFADLESLTLHGGDFQKMPFADSMREVFPKLKSIWFQNVRVSPTNALDHILEMPSVEKLWFRNVHSDMFPEPIPLYFFDRRPKEWLENIKLISADQWERYIPYSRLINLELVAFFSRDKTTGVTDTDVDGTLPRSLENIFKELRNCSKLKGLILHIPDGFRCAVLNELPQKLEFVAISGANIDEVKSALECLYPDQTRLEEVWIRVFNTSKLGFEENIELLMRFKHLKRVVFVYKPCSPPKRSFDDDDDPYDDYSDDECGTMRDQLLHDFERVLQEFADRGCCWKQATLLNPIVKKNFAYKRKVGLPRKNVADIAGNKRRNLNLFACYNILDIADIPSQLCLDFGTGLVQV
ncbi:unnamed protein product [Notodromas monacha]|uniref:F-box domain-containing protein n=1 Tax=Notodromas monacha TaxID=399045 RepID=A0A7R9GHK2_9CRUS|nr:unnamed protein product [Notodromas monacha]CAG0922898.1 unnamed protein product [Notodromas monacha]